MRRILILDTETTGLDETATCIEVAALLYDVQHAAVVRSFSSLIRGTSNAAESVNRIPVALLADAPEPAQVWGHVGKMSGHAEAIVAHNASFDRRFVPVVYTEMLPWICSCNDLEWPLANRQGESLITLALAHGLGVASAHRAMADCDLLARLLTRVHEMGHDIDALLARGLRPKVRLVVAERGFSEARNAQAKTAGFRWDSCRREWAREMPPEDATALPFATHEAP